MSRLGLAERHRYFSRRTSVRIRLGSPFSSKVVVCGHCLVTLSLTINKTLKSLSSPPILMQKSYWRWRCRGRCINLPLPPPHVLSVLASTSSGATRRWQTLTTFFIAVVIIIMFLKMYLWWSLCTLYLHVCQVRATRRRLRSLLLY